MPGAPAGSAVCPVPAGGVPKADSAWHYHAVNRVIEEDRVKPNRGLVLVITASVALLAAAMTVAAPYGRRRRGSRGAALRLGWLARLRASG